MSIVLRHLPLIAFCILSPLHANAIGIYGGESRSSSKPFDPADAAIQDALKRHKTSRTGSVAHESSGNSVARPTPVIPARSEAELNAEMKTLLSRSNSLIDEVLAVPHAPIRLPDETAAQLKRLNLFFDTMKQTFFERDPLLKSLCSSLLSEGSILIIGPGGTAKSAMADFLGRNIIEPSYFSLQLTPETTASETMGGLIMKEAEEGRSLRNWREGVLGADLVFLDEFFDGRMKYLRTFLKAFNEREYVQGKIREQGRTKVFIAAPNKYLNQIYEQHGNNDPQAMIDRFLHVYFAPGVLRETRSILGLFRRQSPPPEQISFAQLGALKNFSATLPMSVIDALRTQHIYVAVRRKLLLRQRDEGASYRKAKVNGEWVQPPYRTTRVFSARSLSHAFHKVVQNEALMRISNHLDHSPVVAVTSGDVDVALAGYLAMQGPSGRDLQEALEAEDIDPYEESQLKTLQWEQTAVSEVLEDLHALEQEAIRNAQRLIDQLAKGCEPSVRLAAKQKILSTMEQAYVDLDELDRAEKIGAPQIAALEVLSLIRQSPLVKAALEE